MPLFLEVARAIVASRNRFLEAVQIVPTYRDQFIDADKIEFVLPCFLDFVNKDKK